MDWAPNIPPDTVSSELMYYLWLAPLHSLMVVQESQKPDWQLASARAEKGLDQFIGLTGIHHHRLGGGWV